jgi:acyl-CoA oxidase
MLPLLARTVILNFGLNYVKDVYQRNDPSESEEIVRLCCVIKTLISWNAERVATVGRERCGGAGYLSVNRLGIAIGFAHATMTAEGDNSVLMQKVSKELLSGLKKGDYKQPQLTMCPHNQLPKRTDIDNIDVQLELLRAREIYLASELSSNMATKMKAGADLFDVWMKQESNTIQSLAMSYGERMCLESALTSIETADASCRAIFTLLARVYSLDVINREIGFYMTRGLLTVDTAATVEARLNESIKELAPSAMKVVDSLGIPEHAVRAPIALNYEKYQEGKHEGEFPEAKL